MKLYLLILLVAITICVSGYGQERYGFRIVYNDYYKRYAVMVIDSVDDDKMFLLMDIHKEFGFYSEISNWNGSGVDHDNSTFKNREGAKAFLRRYLKWKNSKWK